MIDLKDIKILSILSQNGRETYSKIAKKIGLSNDSVKNRITKLEKNEIIKAFKINLNYSKLGFLEYDLYLKLKNYNEKELKQIISSFENSFNVTWIGTCFGKFDLRISLIVKNNNELINLIESQEKKLSKYITEIKTCYLIEKYKINQIKIISNLFNIETQKIETLFKNKIKKVENKLIQSKNLKLDETDKKIIFQLNGNPRENLVKISSKINLTPEAIKYRLKELNNKEILNGTSAIINGNTLNKIWAVFLFKLESSQSNEFINFISKNKNVSSFVKIMGEWNYSVSVFANNVKEIHQILMEFRNKFPNLIKDYEMLLIFETYKYPQIPKCILKE